MKKAIIYSIIFFLLAFSVFALDCQYTENERYQQEVNVFYEDGHETDYSLLEAKELTTGSWSNWYGSCLGETYFKVYNNYDQQINVTVKYVHEGTLRSQYFWIDPKGYIKINYDDCIMEVALNLSSVEYDINSSYLESKKETKTFEREVCKQCPAGSGFVCLNDGVASDNPEKCGSEKMDIKGLCINQGESPWITGDGNCTFEVGENCGNSPIDCKPEPNQKCEGTKIIPDCNNPPEGMQCCNSNFKKIKEVSLGFPCDCDFECEKGQCFQGACQILLEPKIKCPSGTNIKKGGSLICNIYASNTKLDKDIKVTFELESGSGLSFSESYGCMNIKGSQCIGTYDIVSLSNEGIEVGLNAISGGDTNIDGKVTFDYKGKKISEEVKTDFDKIHIYYCGDNNIDFEETKNNCCQDVGVSNSSFFRFKNERCDNNMFSNPINWNLILSILVILGIVFSYFSRRIIEELTKLNKAEQEKISKHIEKINAEITKKEKEIEIDRRLALNLKEKKEQQKELDIIKQRIQDSQSEINELRNKEKAEKEKLKIDRLKPFTNKEGYSGIIINEEGYEQFAKSIKYPAQSGLLFHRWYAKKFIYNQNRHKYSLPWDDYEVHHKDGNKRNNDLSNLEIDTKGDHKRKHNL